MKILEQYADLQQLTNHKGRHRSKGIVVTVYKSQGSFNLSPYAYKALGCPTHVLFFYSDTQHVGIITQASRDNIGALKLYPRNRSQAYFFHGKLFCEKIGISLDRLHRYETEVQDGALVVHLDKEIESVDAD